MKSIKYVALGLLLTVSVFCAVMYTSSCTKDACKGVTCLHKGTCTGGGCFCVDPGIGGLNCEIIYRDLYKNTYEGNALISYTFDTTTIDTGYVAHTDNNNTLSFSVVSDTAYSQMQLIWTDGSTQMLQTVITLANNSSTGSTFLVPATPGGPGGAFTVSGNGSVSGTMASVNLTAVSSDTTMPAINITLSNFIKQ